MIDALHSAWEMLTSDATTLAGSTAVALALLTIAAFALWPRRAAPPRGASARSAQARALSASGASLAEVARRTGLSRDALALVIGRSTEGARQKGPATAPLARRRPFAARLAPARSGTQLPR